MKLILAPIFICFIFSRVGNSSGHKTRLSHDKVDKKELLKDILWNYFWHKDDIKNHEVPGSNIRRDVGFLCSLSGNLNVKANSAIHFDKVVRNAGHGYSEKTGTFTAPVGGLYHFYWSSLAYKSSNFDITLMHNGSRVSRSYVEPRSSYDYASNTVYLRIKKKDTIFLQTFHNAGMLHGGLYTTFGGELIRY